jgi:nucleotide-binding universal stress UspA family protein
MLDLQPRKIVVCVSPGEDCQASLDFALAEAQRRGCGIHLALSVGPVLATPPDVFELRLVEGEWRRYGTDFLIDCERRLKERGGDAPAVSTEITHGAVVPSLVEVSENAALVVLQHHRMGRAHVIPTRSITNGVAARAHAAVVAVPDTWRESRDDSDTDVVAVGVEDSVSSAHVARWAFEEARRAGGSVRLVRAWYYNEYDVEVFAGEAGRAHSESLREEVRRQFAALTEEFPDVPHDVVALHGQPADVLVSQSHHVRRLVVGRHEPRLPLGSHLGPVTRAVLNHAVCPVVVVDPRGETGRAASEAGDAAVGSPATGGAH